MSRGNIREWGRIAVGTAAVGLGSVMVLETTFIREALKLSKVIPGTPGVNWAEYALLCQQLSKPVVDGLISVGMDLGGAMGLIGISEALGAWGDEDGEMMAKIWSFTVVGVLGAIGTILEVEELARHTAIETCAATGCGSYVDLAIFFSLALYPWIRRHRNHGVNFG